MIRTVKGFSVVDKAEGDVFLELPSALMSYYYRQECVWEQRLGDKLRLLCWMGVPLYLEARHHWRKQEDDSHATDPQPKQDLLLFSH